MSKNLDEILCEENLLEELKPYTDDPECRKFARLFACYVFDSNRHLTQEGEKQFKQQIQKTFKGEEKIMWSPLAKRYGAAGIKQGIKQGIEIGRAEGEAKGKTEGEVESIISILDVKFGEISETVRNSLYAVTDVNRLQELVRFAAKCDTFEEFFKKLKQTKSKQTKRLRH
jgi:hypothetical protein